VGYIREETALHRSHAHPISERPIMDHRTAAGTGRETNKKKGGGGGKQKKGKQVLMEIPIRRKAEGT